MTIKIGTIQEMTGIGYEVLVDSETRTEYLAAFMDGNLVSGFLGANPARDPNVSSEPTLAM